MRLITMARYNETMLTLRNIKQLSALFNQCHCLQSSPRASNFLSSCLRFFYFPIEK